MTIFGVAVLCIAPAIAVAQPVDSLDLTGKLTFHAETVFSPLSLLGSAAYAGVLQGLDAPKEWGQGGEAYAQRVGSTIGANAIHGALAFGLDSALHEDPRYFRLGGSGFWRRSAHAFRGTILTRTDSGGETFSVWRFGSAYGEAYLSNQWYPDRLNTVRLGALQGTLRLGFDFAGNLASEFWPDVKRKLHHQKP